MLTINPLRATEEYCRGWYLKAKKLRETGVRLVMDGRQLRCSVIAPAVPPTDGSAGLADGGSGHADTTNSGPT